VGAKNPLLLSVIDYKIQLSGFSACKIDSVLSISSRRQRTNHVQTRSRS